MVPAGDDWTSGDDVQECLAGQPSSSFEFGEEDLQVEEEVAKKRGTTNQCHVCNLTFGSRRKKDLISHIRREHLHLNCAYCGVDCVGVLECSGHEQQCEARETEPDLAAALSGDKLRRCRLCVPVGVTNNGEREGHYWSRHWKWKCSEQGCDTVGVGGHSRIEHRATHLCEMCNKVKSDGHRHCPVCVEHFDSLSAMKLHLRECEAGNQCRKCKASLARLRAEERKDHVCMTCPYAPDCNMLFRSERLRAQHVWSSECVRNDGSRHTMERILTLLKEECRKWTCNDMRKELQRPSTGDVEQLGSSVNVTQAAFYDGSCSEEECLGRKIQESAPGPGREELISKFVEMVRRNTVTRKDTTRLVERFERELKEIDGDPLLASCVVCGVERFRTLTKVDDQMEPIRDPILPISTDDIRPLLMTSAELSEFNAIEPEEYQECHNSEILGNRGHRYWIDKASLNGNKGVLKSCRECLEALKGGKRPTNSVANKHLGFIPEELGLERMTATEEQMIGFCRLFMRSIQMKGKRGAKGCVGIKGHVVTVPHDGVQQLRKYYQSKGVDPEADEGRDGAEDRPVCLPDVNVLLHFTHVVWVGIQGEWDKVKECMWEEVEQRIRPKWGRMVKWLRFLQAVNPKYKDVQIVEEQPDAVDEWVESVRENAVIVPPVSEAAGADITRQHAEGPDWEDDDEMEEILMAEGMSPMESEGMRVKQTLKTLAQLMKDAGLVRKEMAVNVTGGPLCEFTGQDEMLYDLMPTLFPFRSGIAPAAEGEERGPLSNEEAEHLLDQTSQRFAESPVFGLLLFNQRLRHKGLAVVKSKMRDDPKLMSAFRQLLNDEELPKNLREAVKNPKGAMAKRLEKDFWRIIRPCHSRVPFSSSERQLCYGDLTAMKDWFGPPTMFVTMSFDDWHNHLVMRLSSGEWSKEVEIKSQFAKKYAVRNPSACTRVFERFMRMYFTLLLGMPCVEDGCRWVPMCDRQSGIFGKCTAHYTCYECQSRGTLHAHGLVWTNVSAETFELVCEHLECSEALAKMLDSWIITSMDAKFHDRYEQNYWADKDKDKDDGERDHPLKHNRNWVINNEDDFQAYLEAHVSSVVECTDVHQCVLSSCMKLPVGKEGCRFYMFKPAGLDFEFPSGSDVDLSVTQRYQIRVTKSDDGKGYEWDLRTDVDELAVAPDDDPVQEVGRLIIWIGKRPDRRDGRIVDNNFILTAVCVSNTSVQFLGGASTGLVGLARYVVGYCTKDPNAVNNVVNTMQSVLLDEQATRSEERTPAQLLKRLVNSVDRRVEFSPQMAMLMLHGNRAHKSSHCFSKLFPLRMMDDLKYVRKVMEGEEESSDDESESGEEDDDGSEDEDISEQSESGSEGGEGEEGEGRGRSTQPKSDEAGEGKRHGRRTEPKTEDDDLPGGAGGDCIIGVEHDKNGRVKAVFATDTANYVCRGSELAVLSYLEYMSLVRIVPKASVRNNGVEACTGNNVEDAREAFAEASVDQGIKFFPLSEQHPLHTEYVQVLAVKMPVPVICGKVPKYPSAGSRLRVKNAWAKYILALVTEWDVHNLPGNSWKHYLEWAKHCREEDASFVDQMRFRFSCNLAKTRRSVPACTRDVVKKFNSLNRKLWCKPHELDMNYNEQIERQEKQRLHKAQKKLVEVAGVIELVDVLRRKKGKGRGPDSKVLEAIANNVDGLFCHSKETKHMTVRGHTGAAVRNGDFKGCLQQLLGPYSEPKMTMGKPSKPSTDQTVMDREFAEMEKQLSGLTGEQKEIAMWFVDWLRMNDPNNPEQDPLRIFVQGDGGVGKSYMVKMLKRVLEPRFGSNVMRFFGPTGRAAANLPFGCTVHNGFAMPVRDFVRRFSAAKVMELRALFEGTLIIVIDEVGMMNPEHLHYVDKALREISGKKEEYFGGYHMLLMGDIKQLLPVSAVTPVWSGIRMPPDNKSSAERLYDAKPRGKEDAMSGVNLFADQFLAVRMTEMVRQKGRFKQVMKAFGDFSSEGLKAVNKFKRSLRCLEVADLMRPEWSKATVVCPDNMIVDAINKSALQRLSAETGRIMFEWKRVLNEEHGRLLSTVYEELYENIPDPLMQWFVYGALCTITTNLNTQRGIVNGTIGYMHSLVPDEREPTETWDIISGKCLHDGPVCLQYPPTVVNVMVPLWKDAERTEKNVNVDDIDDAHVCYDEEGNEYIVVPLERSSWWADVSVGKYLGKEKSAVKGTNLKVMYHPFRPLYACTYHGVQCLTLERVVLCIENTAPLLNFELFYTGVSRVRNAKDIGLISIRSGLSKDQILKKILCVVPSVRLVQYSCYISDGTKRSFADTEKMLQEIYAGEGIDYKKRKLVNTARGRGPAAVMCRKEEMKKFIVPFLWGLACHVVNREVPVRESHWKSALPCGGGRAGAWVGF